MCSVISVGEKGRLSRETKKCVLIIDFESNEKPTQIEAKNYRFHFISSITTP